MCCSDIHVEDPEAKKECGLTEDDQKLLIGTLDLKGKKVGDVMTRLDQVYMLEKNTKLDFDKLSEIYKSVSFKLELHSEILLYNVHTQNLLLI